MAPAGPPPANARPIPPSPDLRRRGTFRQDHDTGVAARVVLREPAVVFRVREAAVFRAVVVRADVVRRRVPWRSSELASPSTRRARLLISRFVGTPSRFS